MRIWTLDARESVLLDVIAECFDLSDADVRREVRKAWERTTDVLSMKGIDYSSLRAALTPQRKRNEVAYLFNSSAIEAHWYGFEVARRVLHLLVPSSSCSLLAGDLVAPDQERAFQLLNRHLHLDRPVEISHTNQLYAIYINNLSDAMSARLHEGLLSYDPYVGYIPCNFSSPARDWLSFTIGSRYVKARHTFICGHEDDIDNEENYNLPGWPVDDFGYRCASIQSMYYDLFLSYKIERAVYRGFEGDTAFALKAISGTSHPLEEMTVVIEPDKLEYLARSKFGLLTSVAGVSDLTEQTLRNLVASRIRSNYIYDLRFHCEPGVSLFTIMVEIVNREHSTPAKLAVSLEYQPIDKVLRVITIT